MTTTAQPKMKAYVSQFVVHLGPITMNGRLISIKQPGVKQKAAPFVLATPNGDPVVQRYIVESDPSKLYTYDELTRAVKTETGLATVEHAGIVADTKKSDLPKDVLNLTVHPKADVDAGLFAADSNAYVFEPDASDPVNLQWHSLMLALLTKDDEHAFIGVCNLRNNEGLFRLVVWRGRIVVQKMTYPADLHDHGALEDDLMVDLDDKTVAKAMKMAASLNESFVPQSYVDATREKLTMLADVVAGTTSKPAAKKAEKKKSADFDLDAALEAFA